MICKTILSSFVFPLLFHFGGGIPLIAEKAIDRKPALVLLRLPLRDLHKANVDGRSVGLP